MVERITGGLGGATGGEGDAGVEGGRTDAVIDRRGESICGKSRG